MKGEAVHTSEREEATGLVDSPGRARLRTRGATPPTRRARPAPAGHGPRDRARRLTPALCALLVTCGVAGVAGAAATPPAASAAPAPSCVFGPAAISAVVFNVKPGSTITFACKNMPASTEFMLVETSLLVAVDPLAQPLLTGSITSPTGLLALVAALPEMNATSEAFVTSDASGVLDTSYTVPTSQPLDPNATCPPSTEQYNSGLVGCAVAMIDMSDFKPVSTGTAVINFANQPLFPPDPTLALSKQVATDGQTQAVGDAPGATTYWWVATLSSLYNELGGGKGGPIPVTVRVGGHKVKTDAAVTPATYEAEVFTPPKLSGTFVVGGHGPKKVKVTLTADLLGVPLSVTASARFRVLR